MHSRNRMTLRRGPWGWVAAWVIAAGLLAPALQAGGLFADPNLEAAVRRQVFGKRDNSEPLVEADVAQISSVEARNRGIRSLAGLEKCRSLAQLDLAGNDVTDLAPLGGLARLQFLDVQRNQVTSLAPLATLPALQYLQLAGNRIASVRPLAGLTNLSALYLSGNRIEDIGPLLGLRRLASLYLDDNRIRSLDGLGRLRGLSSLSLSGNRLDDVGALQGLEGVQHLFLERNRLQRLDSLIAWVNGDTQHRFAPFLEVYLAGNPLGSEARTRQIQALSATGVRVHRAPIPGAMAAAAGPGAHGGVAHR